MTSDAHPKLKFHLFLSLFHGSVGDLSLAFMINKGILNCNFCEKRYWECLCQCEDCGLSYCLCCFKLRQGIRHSTPGFIPWVEWKDDKLKLRKLAWSVASEILSDLDLKDLKNYLIEECKKINHPDRNLLFEIIEHYDL